MHGFTSQLPRPVAEGADHTLLRGMGHGLKCPGPTGQRQRPRLYKRGRWLEEQGLHHKRIPQMSDRDVR